MRKVDRTGEEGCNKFGSKMIIIGYSRLKEAMYNYEVEIDD